MIIMLWQNELRGPGRFRCFHACLLFFSTVTGHFSYALDWKCLLFDSADVFLGLRYTIILARCLWWL
jgi:hypothetical protein